MIDDLRVKRNTQMKCKTCGKRIRFNGNCGACKYKMGIKNARLRGVLAREMGNSINPYKRIEFRVAWQEGFDSDETVDRCHCCGRLNGENNN